LSADNAGQRPTERNAHDREGDREGPLAPGHVLGRERGRIRHRTAKAQAGEESQGGQDRDAAGKRD